MSHPADLSFPVDRLGKYELRGAIGDGGMGRVFRAVLRGPAQATREVAIKVLHSNLGEDHDFTLMFLDEMRVAMALSHRNIVQTFDAGAVDERYYMVMELVEGCSLRGLLGQLQQPPVLPVDIALFIGKEISAALDYAHRFSPPGTAPTSGVVHRDVSPSNVLLSSQGDVKLTDFGVAKAAGRLSVTNVATIKGKLAYMAPEQARGEVCPASDLFALGAVLYELLAGQPIRPTLDLQAVRDGAGIPAILRERRPEIPTSLERIVMSCLGTRVEDRPSSAAELREALAQELFQLELTAQLGPDAHARLSRFLAETPTPDGAASSRARAALPGGGGLAQQLLRQAEERPEPTEVETRVEAGDGERITVVDEQHSASFLAPAVQGAATQPDSPLDPSRAEHAPPSRRASLVRFWAPATLLVGLALVLAWGLGQQREERAEHASMRAPARIPSRLPLDSRVRAAHDSVAQADRSPGEQAEPRTAGASVRLTKTPRRRSVGREKRAKSAHPAGKTLAPAQLWVMSRKEGRLQWAAVLLDGRNVGQTPLRLEVAPGRHRLEIRRSGHLDESRQLVLVPGQALKVFFELREVP